jgi:hypothetical protein
MADTDGADSGEAVLVVSALRTLGYANAYGVPVAPWLCSEPIVVCPKEFERESLQTDGSIRGTRKLVAIVCMDDPTDAETTARTAARELTGFAWQHLANAGGLRPISCDVAQPEFSGRDSSGRWLWQIQLSLEVVVEHV